MTRTILQRAVDWGRRNSPWIIRFHSGSCCGCDDEADYEVTCPQCGEVVPVYEDDLSFGNIICPGCGETLEFDFDETDEPDGED